MSIFTMPVEPVLDQFDHYKLIFEFSRIAAASPKRDARALPAQTRDVSDVS